VEKRKDGRRKAERERKEETGEEKEGTKRRKGRDLREESRAKVDKDSGPNVKYCIG